MIFMANGLLYWALSVYELINTLSKKFLENDSNSWGENKKVRIL